MDQSTPVQNRRSRRSNVLMTATLELSGAALPVKLRNLSEHGALVEGERLPVEGANVRFCRNELKVDGKIAWVKGARAGVTFIAPLSTEAVMHHIPAPKPRSVPQFKRPGLAPQDLSAGERKIAADWVFRPGASRPGE